MSDSWIQLTEEVVTCRKCPRLVEWREQMAREKRKAYEDWEYWGKPVPGFGDVEGRMMIVGLAPGAHGSNRTGRPFTGDSSGNTLYPALHYAGFANQAEASHRGDGLQLTDAFVTAVGRCAPPQNKPTAQELTNCRPYFYREWVLMPQLEILFALGGVAFNGCKRLLRDHGYDVKGLKFGHGVQYEVAGPDKSVLLMASYHPSRQNTNTGRLTQQMLNEVFAQARALLS